MTGEQTVAIRQTTKLLEHSHREGWDVEKRLTDLAARVHTWMEFWGGFEYWREKVHFCQYGEQTRACENARIRREEQIRLGGEMADEVADLFKLQLPNDLMWLSDLYEDALYCQWKLVQGLTYLEYNDNSSAL